jgi:hypothetical protein
MYRNCLTLALVSSISVALSACVPSVSTYWRVTAPGAVYLNSVCYGEFGPRSITYYPYHGIFISVEVTDLPGVEYLAFHIPTGSVVQLNGTSMQLQGRSSSGPFSVALSLGAVPHGNSGGPRKLFNLRPDPYTAPDNFGPLKGDDDDGTLLWYNYATDGSIPEGMISGTLTLPSLTINGQRYEAQTLTFTRDKFVGVTPINC